MTRILLLLAALIFLPWDAGAQSQFPPYIPQNCTVATLPTAACVQQVDGSVAVITDGNAADLPDRCAAGATGGGTDVVTCERIDGAWHEIIPNADIEADAREIFCNVTAEDAADTDFVFCGFRTDAVSLNDFRCVATGGTVPTAQVDVMVCDGNGANCTSSALVNVTALETPVATQTFSSDPDAGDWWAVDFGPVTVAPEFLHCQVTATR